MPFLAFCDETKRNRYTEAHELVTVIHIPKFLSFLLALRF
jgi:hypothetical protein